MCLCNHRFDWIDHCIGNVIFFECKIYFMFYYYVLSVHVKIFFHYCFNLSFLITVCVSVHCIYFILLVTITFCFYFLLFSFLFLFAFQFSFFICPFLLTSLRKIPSTMTLYSSKAGPITHKKVYYFHTNWPSFL